MREVGEREKFEEDIEQFRQDREDSRLNAKVEENDRIEHWRRDREWAIEKWRSDREFELDNRARRRQDQQFLHETVINFAGLAIRAALFLNGGAAIAVLTFSGAIIAHSENPSGTAIYIADVALRNFILGVFFAAASGGLAYFTQYVYMIHNHWSWKFYDEHISAKNAAVAEANEKGEDPPKWPEYVESGKTVVAKWIGYLLHTITIGFVVATYVFFAIGVWDVPGVLPSSISSSWGSF